MKFIEVETTEGKSLISVKEIIAVTYHVQGCVIYTEKVVVNSIEPYEEVVGTLKGL